jgi:tape measure domain-containing protein
MADRLVIQIDGNSTGLQKALQSAENRLNSFNTRVTNSSRNLTNFINRMKSVNASMAGFNTSLQMITAANARLAEALTVTTNRINTFGNSARRAGASARSAGAGMGSMNIGVRDLIMGMTSLNTLIYTSAFLFGGITKSVIDANSRMEKMTVLLKNISGYNDEATKSLYAKKGNNFIWDMAENAPFKVENISKAFVKLKANGVDPMNGSLKSMVDAISNFGGGSEELERASTAISQMLSKGSVQLEDLKGQLAETGGVPSAIRDMAKAAGFNDTKKGLADFFAAMKKGAVDSATVIPKLFKVWEEKYAGASEKMMNTWDGLMSRMGTAWSRMIVRVTQDQGAGSLFETLKKQFLDLTNFMQSQQGDKFMADLTAGLGRAVVVIADAIKWVYKWREEILSAAEAIAKLWVLSKVTSMIGSLVGGLNTMLGAVRTARTAVIAFKASGDALGLAISLLGENTAAAAVRLGLFTSAGALSFAAVAALAGGIVALGAVIYAFIAYQGQMNDRFKATGTVSLQTNIALKASAEVLRRVKAETEGVTFATEQQRLQHIATAKQQAAGIKVAMAAARANVILARSAYFAAKAQSEKEFQTNYADSMMSGASTAGMGGAAGLGQVAVGNAADKSRGSRNAADSALKKVGAQYQTWKNYDEALKVLMDDIKLTSAMSPVVEAGGGGTGKKDKKKADPLGDLDGQRSQLVSRLMKNAKLKAELADTGDGKAIQIFDDNAEAIEDGFRKQAMAIKSQKELNAAIATQKGLTYGLTTDVRKHNDALKEYAKNQEKLEQLTNTRTDQDLQAEEAIGNLSDVYNNITNQVERYNAKLVAKNELDNKNGSVTELQRQTQATEILAATESYRAELLAKAAQDIHSSSKEIFDGLLTEEQQRQSNFDREMARVQLLIAENAKLKPDGKGTNEKIDAELRGYVDALKLKKRIEDNPFASWAMGIKDVKAGVNDTLVGSLDGFVDQLASGKMAFGDFAKSLIADLMKVIIKAYLAKAILGALGLGGGLAPSGVVSPTAGMQAASMSVIQANPGIFHSGGMVGGKAPATRSVDAGMFKFAKRYHSGGFPGLAPDEVPIIAQKGEGVFTAEQMKALGGGAGGKSSGGNMAPPTINIINQTGSEVSSESAQPRFDGEQMIVDVILKHGSKPGPVRNMMMGR